MNQADKIAKLKFNLVYPMLLQKVENKGRTKAELDQVIQWLTGYSEDDLAWFISHEADYRTFFDEAPLINPAANEIRGVICGIRVEEIEDPLSQKARWLDKLVDELAKGKAMDKILRQPTT